MIDVKEALQDAQDRMEMAAMYLEEQLSRVRAGRANVAILDGVRVESYGMTVPSPSNLLIKRPSAILKRPSWTAMWASRQRTTAR